MASLLLGLASLLPLTIAQTTGTFNTLSFNVAGLPEILNGNDVPGDKTANTARIGQLFAQYNMSLIHVQEDFNYHATLYANDNHPYRTATSGGVPFGSGLNSLSNYNWVDFERIKWNTCSNTDSADCLTPKGFTFMRVKFAEGVWIDAINLHADAGTTDADLVARAANIQQVSDFVAANSKGNPVLIFGDTNTRYTRSGDNPRLFGTANGMTDAWVELIKGGTPPAAGSDALVCENPSTTTACETVDKIWYRASPALSLKATKFQYASSMFLQADGNILSDHNPVLVDFAWSLNSQWGVADPFGGEYGTWFNDIGTLSSVGSPKVSSITLRGGSRVDAVSFTLSTGATLSHGGTGGTAVTLKLNDGETIKSARLCRGERSGKLRVFSLKLTTSASRTVSTGVETSDCVEKTAASGYNIVGFLGRDGDEVDKLGFIFGKA